MIGILLGAMFGGTVGLFTACLCISAGQADREMFSVKEERPITERSDSDTV